LPVKLVFLVKFLRSPSSFSAFVGGGRRELVIFRQMTARNYVTPVCSVGNAVLHGCGERLKNENVELHRGFAALHCHDAALHRCKAELHGGLCIATFMMQRYIVAL
jgi:hypothetical protein